MGPAHVLLVLAMLPSAASVRRVNQSQSIAAIQGTSSSTRVDTQPRSGEGIDPLELLSSHGSGVDDELQPPSSINKNSDRRIDAILTVEELVEREHDREEEGRLALNCHKFGNDHRFRRLMASSDHPGARATGVDPHIIAVERETLDEPSVPNSRSQIGTTSEFNDGELAASIDMGSTELHKCVLLSYTSNRIEIKTFTNEITGEAEAMELPTFPQSLGVFQIDALFHNREALAKNEFYIVIFEAIDDASGLATCSLAGDPTGAAPKWNTDTRKMDPDERDKDVKGNVIPKSFRKTWVVHGQSMENDVENMAEDIAAHIKKHMNPNEELKALGQHIKKAEKHIPFNHKLETAKVTFKKCATKKGAALQCNLAKVKYLHDKAFTTSSEQHPTLDYVHLSSSESQNVRLDTSPGFVFPAWSTFKGSKNAEVKGSIDWHTTISSKDRCIPAMKQWFYVGLGTDSDADLDLGIILYKKNGAGQHKRHLLYHGTRASEQILSNGGKHWEQMAEYSGDNLTGAGEGDDEWMFLDLNMLKVVGVDVIAIMAHVYTGQNFDTLKGTFGRFVMGDASGSTTSEQALRWSGAETVDYVDIDELRSDEFKHPAVLIGVLSLEAKKELVLPEKTSGVLTPSFEKMNNGAVLKYPSEDGVHFNLAIKKYPAICGTSCSLPQSVCDLEQKVFGMSSGGCIGAQDDKPVEQPKMKVTTYKERQDSLTTVDSAELEQPSGAVLNPLDLLTPPTVNNGQRFEENTTRGGFQALDGQHLSGQETLQAAVMDMTAKMSHDSWLAEMLVEFPGGPPGTDTLCMKV